MGIYASSDRSAGHLKAAILELLTNAAAGPTEAVANAPAVSGPLSMATIRSAIGGLTSVVEPLVKELVAESSVVVVTNGSENANDWTYTVPE